jgi:hypothetical protein
MGGTFRGMSINGGDAEEEGILLLLDFDLRENINEQVQNPYHDD